MLFKGLNINTYPAFCTACTTFIPHKELSSNASLSPHHMRQLYDICVAPSKTWKPFPAGDHNSSVLEEGYFEAIADFVSTVT